MKNLSNIQTDCLDGSQLPTAVSSVSRSLHQDCRVPISSFSSLFEYQRVLRVSENSEFFVFVLYTASLASGFFKGYHDVVIMVHGGFLAVWFPKSRYINDMPL